MTNHHARAHTHCPQVGSFAPACPAVVDGCCAFFVTAWYLLQDIQAALELQDSMLGLFGCSTFRESDVLYDEGKHAAVHAHSSAGKVEAWVVSAVVSPGLLVQGVVRTKAVVKVGA